MDINRVVGKCLINNQGIYKIERLEIKSHNDRVLEVIKNPKSFDTFKGVLIPGFFNMHSHLGESIFRNIDGSDWSISKYIEFTENYNSKLSMNQKKSSWLESAHYTARNMASNGTIGFCAARSSEIAEIYKMLTMSGYPIMNSCKLIEYKEAGLAGFQSYWNNNKLPNNRIGLFLHSVYANDEMSFELARECMKAGAEFITVHISEDVTTTELERKSHNMSAVALLEKYGLLSSKSILVHCGFCSNEDLGIIKERGATICVCPISNAFLNTQMIDLEKLEHMKIPWCIGTDGLGTGRTLSLLEQVALAKSEYPSISGERYWESITVTPGNIMGNNLYTGNIEVGIKAFFLEAYYYGDDASELIENLVEGKIGYKPIQV